MGGHTETGLVADRADRALELLVAEGDEPAAVTAEEVVVMLAAGADALIARGIAAEVKPLEKAETLELLKRPVDAGPSDLWEPAVDLRRGQRAGLAPEQGDDPLAGRASTSAGTSQSAQGVLGPRIAAGRSQGAGGGHPARLAANEIESH